MFISAYSLQVVPKKVQKLIFWLQDDIPVLMENFNYIFYFKNKIL